MSSNELLVNVNLKQIKNVSIKKRTKTAVKLLKTKVAKMLKRKIEEVKISTALNNWIWRRSNKFPSSQLTVKILKNEDGIIIQLPEEISQVEEEKEKAVVKTEDTNEVSET